MCILCESKYFQGQCRVVFWQLNTLPAVLPWGLLFFWHLQIEDSVEQLFLWQPRFRGNPSSTIPFLTWLKSLPPRLLEIAILLIQWEALLPWQYSLSLEPNTALFSPKWFLRQQGHGEWTKNIWEGKGSPFHYSYWQRPQSKQCTEQNWKVATKSPLETNWKTMVHITSVN